MIVLTGPWEPGAVQFVVIQLGDNTNEIGDNVEDVHILESRLSSVENGKILMHIGLRVIEKRLVGADPDVSSHIYHFLCEKL